MKSLSLFDYIKLLFQKPKEFTKLRSYEKSKNFFMMNRFFSIRYPIQAHMLNNIKINTAEATQYWCDSLSKIYSNTPGWIFNTLKQIKKSKKIKKSKFNIKETTVKYYCEINQCSRKDFDEVLKKFNDKFIKELEELEKIIEQ